MRLSVLLAGLVVGTGSLAAQLGSLDGPIAKPRSYVVFAAEPQTVRAGKRSVIELHFQVVEGFHVNSHTPKSELLIPTKIVLQTAVGVRAEPIEYPAGTTFSFSFDPGEKLDVYAGPFTLRLPVVAEAGEHTVEGTLRYQACDSAACYPPKSLPVQVMFTAK